MRNVFRLSLRFQILLILVVTVLGMMLLIANPGYYSHDELQKLDHVEKYGFLHYLTSYVVLSQGEGFGTPVRPISFFIQGVLALIMKDYPVATHLFAVLTHGIVAISVFLALLRFGISRSVALTSACIFAINPMAIISVGWSAALMDRWYVFFGIGALMCVESYVRRRSGLVALGLVSVLVLAAILSKETAIMLPGLMMLFVLIDTAVIRNKRFWQAGMAMVLPVLVYILYRLPAILSSFNDGGAGGAYSASVGNIFDGLLIYFAYPMLFTLTEAINWVFISSLRIGIAFICHFIVFPLLWIAKGWKFAFGYLYLYTLFLVPVLFIPIKAAHYLYASSIFFSVAIAWLLITGPSLMSVRRLWAGLVLVLVLLHSAVLQVFVYRTGTCMNVAMIGIEAVHMTLGRPAILEMRAKLGAPAHILHRISTGRDKVGDSYPVEFKVVNWNSPRSDQHNELVIDKSCRISVQN